MTSYFFQTKQLAVGYQGEAVLRDVTIEVPKGEIVTLIGPNGVGKSTFLKSIAGQLKPVAGCAFLDQKDLSGMGRQGLSQCMAVVFTDKMYTEMMTCEDVVASGRYPYTGWFGILSEQDRNIVKDSMDMTRVSDIKGREFTRISDGQRQRVLLARALCQQPEIILLDEPVSYLDIRYKLEFLSVLQRLAKKRQMTVIMSLHELDLAQRVSDRVLCVGNGCVERFGTPEEVFRDGYIRELFGIGTGSFEEMSGSAELEAPAGEPQVFVLGGGGSGRETYRRLQRAGIPFAAGIIYTHDLDYPVARALAVETVSVPDTEIMGEKQLEAAKCLVDRCSEAIICRDTFGPWEEKNKQLMNYIREKK